MISCDLSCEHFDLRNIDIIISGIFLKCHNQKLQSGLCLHLLMKLRSRKGNNFFFAKLKIYFISKLCINYRIFMILTDCKNLN